MIMYQRLIIFCAFCAIVVGLDVAQAIEKQGPCEQITAACKDAGFVQGGARTGNGIMVDCIVPIMQGKAQPRKAGKPLPQVDPQLVEACRTRNPSFGQAKIPLSDAGDQSFPAIPPPAAAMESKPLHKTKGSANHPNVVFILTDDLSLNLVQFMPHVLKMQKEGVTFSNYFVTDSLCCPSRSSIFTGRFPHDTGVFKNTGNDGGYLVFRNRGLEQVTFATALSADEYRTAMLGKYLNGYQPAVHPAAPGWTSWAVAGNGYPGFNYNMRQDSKVVRYGHEPTDYLTDVLSTLAVRFIKESADAPFLIEIATFAPHAPYTPAPRDADAFPGLRAPRTLAFNAAPDANAPKWLREIPPLTDAEMTGIDRDFRKRAQSVLAVDKMIGELQAAVAAIGQDKNTYFIFSSDNGYHMGEHRLRPGKMTAFDSDIHVPLIFMGPGVAAGRVIDEVVENIDLCPTFTALAGAVDPVNVDGHSLVPLLNGQEFAGWRTAALIEHHGPLRNRADPDAPAFRSGNPTTYEAIRTRTSIYVEYASGEKEYHDLVVDPYELRNTFSSLPGEEKTLLHAVLDSIKNCHDAKSCWAAGHATLNTTRNR